MLPLSSDPTFHFEILRVLGAARSAGADIAEVLTAGAVLTPGDFESCCQAFYQLAERVKSSIRTNDASRYPGSVRDTMFRAATYYRAADFYLHGEGADPRIDSLQTEQRACFDAAISLLPIPGQRVDIQTDGFVVSAILYRASRDGVARPTQLICRDATPKWIRSTRTWVPSPNVRRTQPLIPPVRTAGSTLEPLPHTHG